MFEGEDFYPEYVGFDYRVAELHLYHYVVRDMIGWAIAHGFEACAAARPSITTPSSISGTG